jgi:hypothetical protein
MNNGANQTICTLLTRPIPDRVPLMGESRHTSEGNQHHSCADKNVHLVNDAMAHLICAQQEHKDHFSAQAEQSPGTG